MQLCGDDVSTLLLVAPPLNPAVDELSGPEAGIHSSRLEEIGKTFFHHR